MLLSIKGQLYVFINTIYGGLLIGFLYDIYRLFRMIKKPGKITTGILDLLFWVIVALISFRILLVSNYGVLRWYTFVGFIAGTVIYMKLLSWLVTNIVFYILNTLSAIIGLICKVFRFIIKTLKNIFIIPARFTGKSISSIFRFKK